jgi:hypothetical protein
MENLTAINAISKMSRTQFYFCKRCGKKYFALPGSQAAKDHLCGDCYRR